MNVQGWAGKRAGWEEVTADAEVLLVVLDDPEVPEVPEVVVVTGAEVVFSLELEKDGPEP